MFFPGDGRWDCGFSSSYICKQLLYSFVFRLNSQGEIIITGSIVPPVPIASKEEIRYTLDPVNTIVINLDA